LRGKGLILLAGLAAGALAIWLMVAGNPPNMGLCIACFLRDISGALGLHTAQPVRYLRPEIVGLVLGAFASALARRNTRVPRHRGRERPDQVCPWVVRDDRVPGLPRLSAPHDT